MSKKPYRKLEKKLASIIGRLARKFSPDQIQHELANTYELHSIASSTEPEIEFWLKCGKASHNLASGMNKWGHDMIDELDEDEGNPDANDI